MKAPSSNIQAPCDCTSVGNVSGLTVGYWSFSGAWVLELAIFRKVHC